MQYRIVSSKQAHMCCSLLPLAHLHALHIMKQACPRNLGLLVEAFSSFMTLRCAWPLLEQTPCSHAAHGGDTAGTHVRWTLLYSSLSADVVFGSAGLTRVMWLAL